MNEYQWRGPVMSGIAMPITSWGFDHADSDELSPMPVNGPLLIFATVVLLAAAALCWQAASRSATPGTMRVAGLSTVAGAALLAGGVWAIVMEVVSHAASYEAPRDTSEVTGFHEETGAGLWLLVAGVVVALVAMVLALRATATRSASTTPTG